MASLRARLVNRYIRRSMKKLALHEFEPQVLRDLIEKRTLPLLPKGVTSEEVKGAPTGEWHRADGAKSGNVLLYLHGGGYVFGSPRTHRSLTYPLALAAEAEVFSLEYRLAPEEPCPAAIEDAVAAYDWLVANGADPSRISIAGDSAGGGLALATLQALRDAGKPPPSCAVLYSPYTDLAVEGLSADYNAESDAMFQANSVRMGAMNYAGDLGVKDPRVSPLYGDMTGLPPLLIFASSSEILFDDSTRLVTKARDAGVEVEFLVEHDLVHVWPVFHPLIPEAREAIVKSGAFIRSKAGKGAALAKPVQSVAPPANDQAAQQSAQ